MKNEPKVSVVIPFYNGVKWLEESIQSILNQSYSNFEIIIVNDGSKEDLTNFLKSYGDKIIYIDQENKGPGAARNRAIEIATGKYIAFQDADDLWVRDKTRKQIDLMEQTGAIWSHTNYENFNDGTSIFKKYSTIRFRGDLSKIALISMPIQTPALIIRKEYFDNNPTVRFGEHMRYGQDSYVFTQIAWDFPIEHLNEYVTQIRVRGGNAAFRARVRIRVRRQMLDFIKSDKKDYKLRKHINWIVKFTYYYYSFFDKIFTKIEGRSGIKGHRYEFISRIICVPVYVIEKIYSKIMC